MKIVLYTNKTVWSLFIQLRRCVMQSKACMNVRVYFFNIKFPLLPNFLNCWVYTSWPVFVARCTGVLFLMGSNFHRSTPIILTQERIDFVERDQYRWSRFDPIICCKEFCNAPVPCITHCVQARFVMLAVLFMTVQCDFCSSVLYSNWARLRV